MNFQYKDVDNSNRNRYVSVFKGTFYSDRLLQDGYKLTLLSTNNPIKKNSIIYWTKRNKAVMKNGMTYNLSFASQVASLYHLIIYYIFF
jgi:hypothetical protein